MPTYNEITRPSVPTYSEIGRFFNLLLINTVDHLLINSTGDRLAISEGADGLYTEITSPASPTYTEVTRPV